MATTKSGKAYTWGYNGYGQLGHGNKTQYMKPTIVAGLADKRVVQVCAGAIQRRSIICD